MKLVIPATVASRDVELPDNCIVIADPKDGQVLKYDVETNTWGNSDFNSSVEAVRGDPGRDGKDGADGKNGKDGIDGKDGKDGIDGQQGPAGKDGKDGQDGQPGRDGLPGRDGIDGKDGKDGLPGAQGSKGDKGEPGIQGLPGKDGKDGINGTNGRDGAQGPAGPQGVAGPAGVGIKGFASGYVDAGQFVTLDNLKFTVTTSGARGLSCATVSGTSTLAISATFGYISGVGGSATNWSTNPTYNSTTPSSSWFGWSFPNAGDGSTYLIREINTDRFYRVNLMIGPGYTKNFISIERLI